MFIAVTKTEYWQLKAKSKQDAIKELENMVLGEWIEDCPDDEHDMNESPKEDNLLEDDLLSEIVLFQGEFIKKISTENMNKNE